jgi:lipopolysaccharide transport system ATP-binding protein
MCSDVVAVPEASVAQTVDGSAVQAAAETAIVVDGIGKCYQIYARPRDRLIEALVPRLQRALGLTPSRFFQEGWALRDASFRVARGETVGIIGRNGSGKSTLLQMVCGTLTPTRGSAQVSGRVAALLELGSGFNPEYTGRENVYMNGTILGMSTAEIDAKFDSIAAFAEIGDFIERPVKTYSSGMYVRLAFAVIAHADADILVIDEALSVGDVFFAQKCMRFLRDFQTHGTVLFVSHSAGSVVSLCDRAIWLDAGRMVMDGPAKDVCEAYHASLYGHQPDAGATAAKAPLRKAVATATDDRSDVDKSLDRAQMRVFRFDPDKAGFGDGGASIVSVRFETPDGRVLQQVEGGEIVRLVAEARANRDIPSPIVGFFVKDRLGQQLFGTNTWGDPPPEPMPVAAGGLIRAEFEFRMPYLPKGSYTVDVAVADGTYLEHVQTIWMHDALVFESLFIPRSTGLVGIPFRSISLDVDDASHG